MARVPPVPVPQPVPQPQANGEPAGATPGESGWMPEESAMPPWMETFFPWMVSFTLHVGFLLLVLALFYFGAKRGPSAEEREPIIIPTSEMNEAMNDGRPGGNPNPGMGDPTREAMQDKFKEIKDNSGWAQTPGDLNVSSYLEGSDGDAVGLIALGTGGGIGKGKGGPGAGEGGKLAMYGTPGGGSGAGPKSSFFGTGGGNASRIVYVLDHSGSMLDSFDFLRQEVKRSVRKLIPAQRFAVIMFSESVDHVFPKTDQLQPATPDNKQQLDAWLDGVKAQGENDDLLDPFEKAFRKAFAMTPAPQLVYFLTDGNHDPRLVDKIREMNPKGKVRINTIAFVKITRESENNLKTIASEAKGKYKFVAEKDLGNN